MYWEYEEVYFASEILHNVTILYITVQCIQTGAKIKFWLEICSFVQYTNVNTFHESSSQDPRPSGPGLPEISK